MNLLVDDRLTAAACSLVSLACYADAFDDDNDDNHDDGNDDGDNGGC